MTIKDEFDLFDSENKEKYGIESCARCPDCFRLPEPIIHANGQVELQCHAPNHFWEIGGDSLPQAMENWNHLIELIKKDRMPA